MALEGITFAKQTVTAQDDRSLYQSLAGVDGILSGCAVSYSGTEVEIADGYVLAAGGVLHITGNTSIDIQSAVQSAGYVRVYVLLDTTVDPEAGTFVQGSILYDFSTTTTFPALPSDDINSGSTGQYGASLCVVSVAADGTVTGVSSVLAGVPQLADAVRYDSAMSLTASQKAQARSNLGLAGTQILNTTSITTTATSVSCAWGDYDFLSFAPGISGVPASGLFVPTSFFSSTTSAIYLSLPVFQADGTFAFSIRAYKNDSSHMYIYLGNSTSLTPRLRVWGING